VVWGGVVFSFAAESVLFDGVGDSVGVVWFLLSGFAGVDRGWLVLVVLSEPPQFRGCFVSGLWVVWVV
jgi:hypothetical protein